MNGSRPAHALSCSRTPGAISDQICAQDSRRRRRRPEAIGPQATTCRPAKTRSVGVVAYSRRDPHAQQCRALCKVPWPMRQMEPINNAEC